MIGIDLDLGPWPSANDRSLFTNDTNSFALYFVFTDDVSGENAEVAISERK